MTLAGLILLRPWWLLALPVLLALGLWLRRRRGGIGDWERAADPALLRAMAALGRIEPGTGRPVLTAVLASAALVALALAGPAVERRDAQSWRNLDGVVFVVDVSASVADGGRWQDVVTLGRFAIAALRTRPAGLVVYAGDAYVAEDMTADTRQLGQTLSLIGADTVPDPGSRPARGLALARRMLDEAEVLAGDVVLITDGAGLGSGSLAEAAAIAARDSRLMIVAAGPETPAMAGHARLGGGRVLGVGDIDGLTGWLSQDARTRLEKQQTLLLFWRDYGRYLLVAALLPLMMCFRRRQAA